MSLKSLCETRSRTIAGELHFSRIYVPERPLEHSGGPACRAHARTAGSRAAHPRRVQPPDRPGRSLPGERRIRHAEQKATQIYGIRVTFNVVGTPSAPFEVQFVVANLTNTFQFNLNPGNGYYAYSLWSPDLDDPIPWSVTMDPTGVSGNTNPVKTASGVFTPIPPSNTVEYYEPRIVTGSETAVLNYTNIVVNEGGYIHFFEIFGEPSSHGAQTVLSVNTPTDGVSIVTAPYGIPVLQIARTNAATGLYEDTETFTAQLNGMLVNPTNLATATWADIAAMPTNWTQWLAPDTICESTDPLIRTLFIKRSGRNFKTRSAPTRPPVSSI